MKGFPFTLLTLCCTFVSSAFAAFHPVPLTPESFTHDVIVERTAPPPLVPVTTASMDTGTNNTGFSFYERGYQTDFITTGLPAPGTPFTSQNDMVHEYQLAPDYGSNNAMLIDSAVPTGHFSLTTPTSCSRLSFLTAAGNGRGTISCRIHHADTTTETAAVLCPDWINTLYPAWATHGRVEVTQFIFADVPQDRPGLFAIDIALANTNSPVTQLDFAYISGDSHNAVFAVSGASSPEDSFVPLEVTGYNADMIVEANATRRIVLSGVTTATFDNGPENWGWTLYERGYYAPAPLSGLPPAGSLVDSASAPDHHFLLPPDYNSNNVALLEPGGEPTALTPQSAIATAQLSILCASAHGPTTNIMWVFHADGSVETNSFVAPDWLGANPAAVVVNGRINCNNRVVDHLDSGSPRLYAVDLALTNSISPVTNLQTVLVSPPTGARTVIFALSAYTPQPDTTRPVLTLTALPGGSFRLTTTQAGRLESTTTLAGQATLWRDEGPIASEIVLTPGQAPIRFYRVVSQRRARAFRSVHKH
ncbi:MAG TPA: hypothetical protein VG167_23150 [Verrucomicrobiae bacterium]|nr:hypothetical protein [Verrucomicrobiae bacterium]